MSKYKLGQYEAAITDYDNAIRLKSDYMLAYNNRGLAKYHLRKYAAAIADYNNAIKIESNDAVIYNNRGVAKFKFVQHYFPDQSETGSTDTDTIRQNETDRIKQEVMEDIDKTAILNSVKSQIAEQAKSGLLKERDKANRKLGREQGFWWTVFGVVGIGIIVALLMSG